jgi:hypothetical protein
MKDSSNPKQMVVEGHDDLFSVVGLMRAHIPWPEDWMKAPVHIRVAFGADEILRRGYIDGLLKGSVVKTLGVMLDADANPHGRYQSIYDLCISFFPGMPKSIAPEGIVIASADEKRFGVWIMPDNGSPGNLETFLKFLVPNRLEPIWAHAVESAKVAKRMGCECRDCHIDKQNLYTWLAWQDPPGQGPGEALTKKVLDPHAAHAEPFVKWFRNLYEL